MIKKIVMMFVLGFLLSSIFAIAQEDNGIYDEETIVDECNFGCKVWQFLFGSTEARAGKAWFDRSEPLVGEAANPTQAAKLAGEAQTLWKQGKNQEAIAKMNEAIKLDPTNPKYYEGKANILWQSGDYKGAAQSYQVLLQNPNLAPDKKSDIESKRNEAIQEYAKSGATIGSVFQEAGYSGEGKDSDGYKARQELYQKLTGKNDYGGSKEQNELILKAVQEGKATVPFKSGSSSSPVAPEASKATEASKLDNVPLWKGEETFPPGTVYKNDKGEYFIANEKGIGQKVTAAVAAQKLKENTNVNPQAKSNFESILGKETYEQYVKNLKAKEVFTRDDGTLVMRGTGGVVLISENKEFGVQIVERSQNGKVLETSIARGGQILAIQKADGTVLVGGSSYNFPKDKSLTSSEGLADLEQGIQLPGEGGEPSGLLKLEEGILTAMN